MTLQESVKTVFSKYATFSGRATRSEFWYFGLFYLIMAFGLIIAGILLGAIFGSDEGAVDGFTIGCMLYQIYVLAAVIPYISVTVRRLHDTNRSGWNYWWCLLPLVGYFVLLVFLLQGSDPKDNKYGPYEA